MLHSATYLGGVCEWSKQAVLKTVRPKGLVGSNPTSSATQCIVLVLRIRARASAIIRVSMARAVFFEWEAMEYAFEEKGADWYWALGIIAVAIAVTSALFGNLILALLVIAASGTLALAVAKHPRLHRFQVTEQGIVMDDNLYTYDNILSFSILEYIDPTLPPALSLKTTHILAPHLLIPVVGPNPDELFEFLYEHIEEGKHDESLMDRGIDMLRL